MPRDSQGNTNPLPGTIVQTGDTILPSQHNPALVDLYAMMSQSLSRDGQGGMRDNLAMNGFQIANLGAATQPGNAVPLSQFQNGTPIGSVIDFAGVTAPDTWLLCFGQTIEVAAYPEFVAACYVGNALNATAGFGYRTTSQTDPSANRSTTGQFIVLPDLRGRVGAGKDDMGGSAASRINQVGSGMDGVTIGSSGGLQFHILTDSQMPIHNHGVSDPGHRHFGFNAFVGSSLDAGAGTATTNGSLGRVNLTGETGVSATGISTVNAGGGLAHNNMQPTLIMNKIIKVSY